jgi:hypothetical protein
MNHALRIALLSLISLSAARAFAEERPDAPPGSPIAPPPPVIAQTAPPGAAPSSPAAPNPPGAAAPTPGAAPESAPPAPPAAEGGDAASLQRRVDQLEQQLKVIDRRWEIEQEQAAERKAEEKKNPPPGVAVAFSNTGVNIKSPDGKFQFRLRPIIQADSRIFFSDNATNTFLLRRVRPVL